MKILLSFLIPMMLLASEPAPLKVAEIEYANLPCAIRKENSGIYAVETFTVASSGGIALVLAPGDAAYEVVRGSELKKQSSLPAPVAVFAADAFQHTGRSLTDNRDGSYSDAEGKRIVLRISGRERLDVSTNLSGAERAFTLSFPGDVAYADLIGIDAKGRMFLVTERYASEIPLKILREVVTLDSAGERLSVLEIPDIKFLSTDKDFRIDAEGNLYHMMTTAERVIVFKWTDLTAPHASPVTYPSEYSYSLHYNNYVTTSEAATDAQTPEHLDAAPVSRAQALRIAESYAMHQYYCSGSNLAPANVTGPDGDIVRTPPWLLSGANARVPYMWGGFSTLAQFDAGLKSGKYAGDINTAGVSGYSVGVDCSGFVSRCWQMSSHYATSMMPGITTQYASWDSLKPGDAILKSGHVRLFIERTPNGGFRVVEAAGRNWDVSYYTYAASDLEGVYTPRAYNSMEKTFSFQRPTLTGVVGSGSGSVTLAWYCDTTNVLGYRIYQSEDGVVWTLLLNESAVGRATTVSVPMAHEVEYYRLSSVKNDGPKTESDWSNAMGASRQTDAAVRWLIVDGFERQTGSFQDPGHTLAVRYGKALAKLGAQFSTVKNSRAAAADSAALMQSNDVIWFLGDESAAEETFSNREQAMLEAYLQSGRHLFVTGSEVGWDLSQNGTASDKEFYSDYLKAVYKADNAGSSAVKSAGGGTFFGGAAFSLGQVYTEDWPDEIDAASGGAVCMRYANGKAAGVQYAGTFGASLVSGKMIYLSFALETTASDSAFEDVIKNAAEYFEGQITHASHAEEAMVPARLELLQNYPNPFNPSTTIRFTVPSTGRAVLKIFNALGQEVATLFDDEARAGIVQSVRFDASPLASGAYFSRLEHAGHRQTRMMMLLK